MCDSERDLIRVITQARIIVKALQLGGDETLTPEQIDAIAHEVGAPLPLPDGMHDVIGYALMEALTDDDASQTFAETVMDSLNGHPFRYTGSDGRTVLFVPIPVER